MRFLADMGVSGSVAAALRALGHDVAHARERGLGRAADSVLLETWGARTLRPSQAARV